MFVTELVCVKCGRRYEMGQVEYTCEACGDDGILDVLYDYDRVKQVLNGRSLEADGNQSLWRYLPLLPLPDGARLPRLSVGCTPIYEAPTLARELGVGRFFVKDDGRGPTASFKDRASAVGTTRALALGRHEIAAASTGNAATSLAGFAADLGLAAKIFVPAAAPEAKVAQLLIYGAKVFLVQGTYVDAWNLCQQAVAAFGWYNRSCAVNPFLVEGKKTGGLEIAEQMRRELPDVVMVPVGDGCIISGITKGLREMQQLGVIDRVPRVIGVQAEGAAPIAAAFAAGGEALEPVEANTLADSIAVGTPRNWRKAIKGVKSTHGDFVTVSDPEIIEMLPRLARASGVFAEPTGVVAAAGIKRARERGLIAARESVLALATGNGLKDVKGAMRAVTLPEPVAPSLDAVRRSLR
ncbi:MAG: threonine synthase [Deltaproteobacteria bacterium]|nr:threonine synthase [Deltaproteobacteria bacterium]